MYVHVPAAWMASFVYAVMAVASAVGLIWRHPLADIAARSRGAAGRGLHARLPGHRLALGRADVGHLVGVGCAADLGAGAVLPLSRLYRAGERVRRSDARPRAGAILALVGVVNLPIIKFSVDWWNTLHQPASVFRLGGPTIAASMLWPLLIMALGFTLFFVTLLLVRMRTALMRSRGCARSILGER